MTPIRMIAATALAVFGIALAAPALAGPGNDRGESASVEEALLAGSIDLAVHSLKDLPTELPEGLTVGIVPERGDPRDALIGKKLDELRPGDRIGTSSLRRAAQRDTRYEPSKLR